MQRSARRLEVVRSWQHAREQFAAIVSERDALRRDLELIQRERHDILATLRALQCAVQERWAAEERCRQIYRERELYRAERDPAAPLQ